MKSEAVVKEKTRKKKAKQTIIKREKHVFDLTGKVFGRAAVEIALLLSGKRKVEYVPNKDLGDHVVAFNLSKIKFKGDNKLKLKKYYHYSGYPGGISEISLEDAMEKDFPKYFRNAVKRMLPKNKLQNSMIKRLTIMKGDLREKNNGQDKIN